MKSAFLHGQYIGNTTYLLEARMVKKLVRHGNSLALVIDKPVLALLKITEETPLEIETIDGKSLQIKPLKVLKGARRQVQAALERTNRKFSKTLKSLAK